MPLAQTWHARAEFYGTAALLPFPYNAPATSRQGRPLTRVLADSAGRKTRASLFCAMPHQGVADRPRKSAHFRPRNGAIGAKSLLHVRRISCGHARLPVTGHNAQKRDARVFLSEHRRFIRLAGKKTSPCSCVSQRYLLNLW